MPTMKKLSLVLSALVLAALLALPAAAQATLAYVKNPLHPTVFVAGDNGSGAKKIEAGETPRVSPDGELVAYLHQGVKNAQELKVAPVAGGPSRTVMVGLREPSYLEWSPNAEWIAALRGPELGMRKLVLIDAATGAQRILATGFFSGFSFSPDGGELVFAIAGTEKFPPQSDLYRTELLPPGAVSVKAVVPQRLTTDHNSSYPLWGPQKIVFVKTVDAKKRKYGPKNELYLVNPNGKGVKRLTHTKVDPLLQGLFPTDWSASGNRLLAEFEGQDTSYAEAVNPRTGGQRPVVPGRVGEEFVGTALSSDGSTVLGYNGGFDPGAKHEVGIVPWPKTKGVSMPLAKNAFEPDWSR